MVGVTRKSSLVLILTPSQEFLLPVQTTGRFQLPFLRMASWTLRMGNQALRTRRDLLYIDLPCQTHHTSRLIHCPTEAGWGHNRGSYGHVSLSRRFLQRLVLAT
jgi:hypothetical protein